MLLNMPYRLVFFLGVIIEVAIYHNADALTALHEKNISKIFYTFQNITNLYSLYKNITKGSPAKTLLKNSNNERTLNF